MLESINQTDQREIMFRGAAWLTVGNFVSRLLGAVYIIPWYIWMGEHAARANGLFTMGYNIYAWFLLISTAGVPVAVAKQIAKYNALNKTDHSYMLLREFLKFMFLFGGVSAIIMYISSPIFANLSGVGDDLIAILQSLSLAVLIFPAMSVIRGFFQGFNDLKPYAISQIAEQLIRVIWMLLTTFCIMNLGSKNYVKAVTQSTLAAFIGMLMSLGVLFYFLWKDRLLSIILQKPSTLGNFNSRYLLLDTLREAIPFIITGSAIQLFQIIDQITFVNSMSCFTNLSKAELVEQFSFFSANPNKITMILIAVASSIGGVGIPLLTENYIKGNLIATSRLVQDNISMLTFFLVPATIGAMLVVKPLYTVFYGCPNDLALSLFFFSLLQTNIMGLYTVLAPMIQALLQNRRAIFYFSYGILTKIILQIPLIFFFHAYGPLISTSIGLILPISLMYRQIQRITQFSHQIIFKRVLLINILTFCMGTVIKLIESTLHFIFIPSGRIFSTLYLIVVGGIGSAVYGLLALRIRLLDNFIGVEKADTLRRKIRIRF